MPRPTTLNPKFDGIGSGRRKCWGCNLKEINQWCMYRWWPSESRSAFAFRVFRKIQHLPTCRRDNWDYSERNEFVKKYCEEAGIDYSTHIRTVGKGGKRGGRVAAKPLML
jgi:hypothetical protein